MSFFAANSVALASRTRASIAATRLGQVHPASASVAAPAFCGVAPAAHLEQPLVPAPLVAFSARRSGHQISEERLHEFLQAEVSFFANKEAVSLSLKKVIDSSTPETAAELVAEELPIRFAQRIMQIESLEGWQDIPELAEVHSLYYQSFRDLRLVRLDPKNLRPFTDVVQTMKGRMKGVIPLLSNAMHKVQRSGTYPEAHINIWLDTFLLARIGTEMLTSQYIACLAPADAESIRGKPRGGIVDHACDPALICDRAAKHVRKLVKAHYKTAQNLEIVIEKGGCNMTGGRIRFPYVPQYLFYVLVELIKNSARATVDLCRGDQAQIRSRPIVITVGADVSQVAIRVSDSAGGIPFSVADRVWSYMYSTAQQSSEGTEFVAQGTPLAGFGVGLPLSRLYCRYLGGSLNLLSLPGIGTRAYLHLKRVESEAREEVPSHSSIHSISEPI